MQSGIQIFLPHEPCFPVSQRKAWFSTEEQYFSECKLGTYSWVTKSVEEGATSIKKIE